MGKHETHSVANRESGPTFDVPDWFEEPGVNFGYRPWQHTPLRPYSDTVIPHQQRLYKVFEALTDVPQPPTLDEGITRLVHMDFMMSNARRQTECASNFEAWVREHPHEYAAAESDPEIRWLLHEAIAGHAHPASLLKIMAVAPSLKSMDLQVLTMPYGYRSKHLPAMRHEMKFALEEMGGNYFDEPIDVRLPKIASHPLELYTDHMNRRGLMVTDKRQVGEFKPDGDAGETIRVIERRAYVVDADPAQGFSTEILTALQNNQYSDDYVAATLYIDSMIESGHQLVVPTSTMVYACRPKSVREPEYNSVIETHRLEIESHAQGMGIAALTDDTLREYIARNQQT